MNLCNEVYLFIIPQEAHLRDPHGVLPPPKKVLQRGLPHQLRGRAARGGVRLRPKDLRQRVRSGAPQLRVGDWGTGAGKNIQ